MHQCRVTSSNPTVQSQEAGKDSTTSTSPLAGGVLGSCTDMQITHAKHDKRGAHIWCWWLPVDSLPLPSAGDWESAICVKWFLPERTFVSCSYGISFYSFPYPFLRLKGMPSKLHLHICSTTHGSSPWGGLREVCHGKKEATQRGWRGKDFMISYRRQV